MASTSKTLVIGIPTAQGIETVAQALRTTCGVEFRDRDSLYWGGAYFRAGEHPGRELFLHRNFDPPTQKCVCPEAIDCPLLFTVRNSDRRPEQWLGILGAALNVDCRVVRSFG